MDQLMVDIGDLNVQSGDEVILIGKEITVEEWANIADSITWEVLCSFSARLPRIYD
jgi:alanine racemase